MNAYMNINVRVISAAARAQIKALQAQVAGLQKQLATTQAVSSGPAAIGGTKQRMSMMKFGNSIQWTGRQLQYNWTIPLVLAGGAATKFALDNEKAFTRVRKVYGDTDATVQWFRKNQDQIPEGMTAGTAAAAAYENELASLGEAFEALSNRYGVAQTEVLETAGAWAAAGVSGEALARSTQLSIKAAVLGDMDLAKATESLIAIQSQYSLSTKELGLTLAELNSIENQTGISMQGLIEGFGRSAGVAREAGVDVRHLGAMLAALVPATGSAATAGNALKTIISRLMSPTGEAADVMRAFGVDTSEAAWQSSTAVERLTILASHMGDSLRKAGEDGYVLSDSQKQVVATVLGSRYQMNRFLVLMREMDSEQGYYQKALDATSDRSEVFATAQKELNDVLKSSPQRLKIIWTTLQNGMADAIQPMIPYLLYMAQSVSMAVQAFTNMDPALQKLVLIMLTALALLPLMIRYFGSLLTLVGAIILPFQKLTRAYVAYATVTKIVDGAQVTTRRSFIAMVAAWIAAPFRKIAAGVWAIGAAVVGAGRWFAALPPVAAAISGAMAAAGAAVGAAFSFALSSTTSAGLFLTSAKFAAFFRQIFVLAQGAMLVLSVLFSKQFFIPLLFALNRFTEPFVAAWIAMWGRIKFAMGTAQIAILAAWTWMRTTLLAGWSGMYLAMISIASAAQRAMIAVQVFALRAMLAAQAAAGAAWVAIQTTTMRVLAGIQLAGLMALNAATAAGAAAGRAIWAGMHTAMALISTAFWSRVISIWIWGFTSLPTLITTARAAIVKGFWAIAAATTTGSTAAVLGAIAPWAILGVAIGALIYMFRDQIAKIWSNLVAYFADSSNQMTQMVIRAWNALPQGVSNALVAVARIVQQAAMQIYEWFSYINPFARHSPSLVENVTKGMEVVGDQFGKASSTIKGHVMGAYRDIKVFGNAVRNLMGNASSFEEAQDRAQIKKFSPNALGAFDRLSARLKTLKNDLSGLQTRLDAQQRVVDRWTDKLDQANAALDRQQDKLDALTDVQDQYQAGLDAAQNKLNEYVSAPLSGMGAMSDAIFENEMAQKRLRLEMMRLEEVDGTLDDVKGRIEAINGAQELLRGTREGLRAGGAGSEILSTYDAQIAALEATKNQQNEASEAIANMSSELDELQRKGELLDLENSLQFDPLTRQIEQAANALEEMPFDKVMAGVRGAASDMDFYQKKLDAATQAVNRQQQVVDRLTKNRDALQDRLDKETAKLDRIKEAYDSVNEAISAVEQTMSDAASAAGTLAQKASDAAAKTKSALGKGAGGAGAGGEGYVSPALQNFRDAAGGNFTDVGGAGIPMRTDFGDQSDMIDKFTQRMADQSANAFADLNPFNAIKDKWNDFKAWMSDRWHDLSVAASDMFSNAFSGIGGGGDIGSKFSGMVEKFKTMWNEVSAWFDKNVIGPLISLWRLFWPSIREFLVNAWEGIKEMFKPIGDELGGLWDEILKMGPAFKGLWNILKPILAVIGGAIAIIAKLVINVLAKTIKPAFALIGGIIGAIIRVVKGALQIVSGLFMLFAPGHFTEGLKKIAAGIGNIFGGLFDGIWEIIKGAFKLIVGVFWGIIDGIWDAAVWLWDELVGHSIIPDIIDAIIWWFQKLTDVVVWVWDNFVDPIIDAAVWLFKKIVAGLKLWWAGFKIAFNALKTAAIWLWDNVLKPIWDRFKTVWDKLIWPALKLWWSGVKIAWNALKTAAIWLWDNVLKPIWDKFKSVWDEYIWPALKTWWAGVKIAWAALKTAAVWLWENVLKPAWDKFKKAWDDYIYPALKSWWAGLKLAWKNLKTAAIWLWNNVLKPAWEKVKEVWEKVGPELKAWWARIRNAWNTLKTLAIWLWNNVLKPAWERVKELWTKVKSELSEWWGNIRKVWNALTTLGRWVWENVMKPVVDKIKEGWNNIKSWLQDNKDMLLGPAKGIVNGIITAINKVIEGLNKVSDTLPGIDFHINLIEKFEEGGIPSARRRVGSGFKTNGARAIVGEGKANYPEFVIPTDPTHRRRAIGLLGMAAAKMKVGMGTGNGNLSTIAGETEGDAMRYAAAHGGKVGGLPAYDIGGWLGDRYDDAKGLFKDIAKLPQNAVGSIMGQVLKTADSTISHIGWTPAESPPRATIEKLRGWVTQTDNQLNKSIKHAKDELGGGPKVRAALSWARSQVGHPYSWGGVGPGGYDCSGFMSAITNHLRGKPLHSRVGATASFPWGGFVGGYQGNGFTIGSTPNYGGSGVGHMAGTLGGVNVESAGGVGVRVGPGARGALDGGFTQMAHLAMKEGGIALARKGPTLAQIGDGRYDEAVVPLPKGWRSELIGGTSTESRVININGNLEFPNITDGSDAEALVDALTKLSGD